MKTRKLPSAILMLLIAVVFAPLSRIIAGPASVHYELRSFGFGAGGLFDATSGTYKINGILGEQSNSATGNTYKINSGLIYTQQASLPPTPSWTNPGSTYNRLKLIIATGGNPTDATYAVAITDNNWADTYYVQSDYTVGSQLGSEDWLTYSQWGGTNGRYITGLRSSTEYRVKVKARTGDYTESAWSSTATATTVAPSLTFSVSSDNIKFNPLTSENSWTDSTQVTELTTSTNAYNGYSIYAHETGPLIDGYGNTINNFGAPNSAPEAWSGTGFGYTTSDNNLSGGTANRFTNDGPNYAGFITDVPGDPVADHVAPVDQTPIVNEKFNITYRVTTTNTKQAGIYQNKIIYIIVPEY